MVKKEVFFMDSSLMEQNKIVTQLVEEFDFNPLIAKVYVAFNGKCVYCGMDLLASSVEYYSAVVDRILPKNIIPSWNGKRVTWYLVVFLAVILKVNMMF
jgi:hypothetical protein